jgi:hypothetical protein
LVAGDTFRDAFTENVILPDSSAAVLLPYISAATEERLQNLAEKWSRVWAGDLTPNHQLLIIGGSDTEGTSNAGMTVSNIAGRTSSWVWRRGISMNKLNGKDDALLDLWVMKTSAHEIAHQWRTNSFWPLTDHCPKETKTWSDPSAFCLLAQADDAGASAISQRTNGIARFHFMTLGDGSFHSEYLEIRKRPDPFVPSTW